MILRSVSHSLGLSAADLKLPVFGTENSISALAATQSDSPGTGLLETASFPLNNLLNPMTHLRWVSDPISGDVFLDCTMASAFTNYIAFASHSLGGFFITIQAATTNSPSDLVEVFESTQIQDNSPLIMEFVRGAYASIRIKISGTGLNGSIRRIAAVLYGGDLLRMPRSVKVDVEQTPFYRGKKTDLLSGWSESGNFLGRLVRNESFESKMAFSNITRSDYLDYGINNWIKEVSPTTPFFTAWYPQDYTSEVGYCWFTEPPMPKQNMMTTRYSIDMSLRGIA